MVVWVVMVAIVVWLVMVVSELKNTSIKTRKTAKDELQKLSLQICELEKVNSAYELNNKELKEVLQVLRQQLAENLDSANKEVQHLSSKLLNRNGTCEFGTQTLEQNEQIVDLELTIKLQLVDKELKTANEEIQKLSSKIGELEKEAQSASADHQMVESELTEKLHLVDRDFKTANEDTQTRISELEKAVFDLQLKDVQTSRHHKLVSELEQHEMEIVQTIKVKHLVEENTNLKKQKLKPPDVLQSDKIETLSPTQKLSNIKTTKVKVLSSNIPHISSPMLTRGRKRRMNLEAPTTSGTQRATKGIK